MARLWLRGNLVGSFSSMTHPEVIRQLFQLRQFGMKLGLEKIRILMRRLGNPQDCMRFIHVAGTNGKGSTCAFLDSLCRSVGLKTGLYTSPHLVLFGERIQVDRVPLSSSEIVSLAEEILPVAQSFSQEDPLTFFEIVTAMALLRFRRAGCDVVVWETGMGGRLDATNIVTPIACVITPIEMDHQQWLGDTIEKIAAEKAGIIKPAVPVITAPQMPAVLEILRARARDLACPFHVVGPGQLEGRCLAGVELLLPGLHQRWNAATALAALEHAEPSIELSPAVAQTALASTAWPGRLQRILRGNGTQELWLDGAHNPHGALALREAMGSLRPGQKPSLILGMMRDKSCLEVLRVLAPMAARIRLVPVDNERTAVPDELKQLLNEIAPSLPTTVHSGLTLALEAARQEPLILVTGSLYLVGEALEALSSIRPGGGPGRALSERLSAR